MFFLRSAAPATIELNFKDTRISRLAQVKMAFFKKRIKVAAQDFIKNEASKVLGDSEVLLGLLQVGTDKLEMNEEFPAYVASKNVLAMGLAGVDEAVQLGYSHAVAAIIENAYGPGRGEAFKIRAAEYMNTMHRDTGMGLGDKLPETMSLALNNMIGSSDESTVICRIGLLFWTLKNLKVSKGFFEDLKII